MQVGHRSEPTATTPTNTDGVTLTTLPLKLLTNIFYFLDLAELYECLCVNKLFNSILHPNSPSAQQCWRGFRKRLKLPDPTIFQLSETGMLKKLASPNVCDLCGEDATIPQLWQCNGARFCSQCAEFEMVESRFLVKTLDPRQYDYLPVLASSGNGNIYLRDSVIHDHIPDAEEIEKLKRTKYEIERASDVTSELGPWSYLLITYGNKKFRDYRNNVYKWLIFKFPSLDFEVLRKLPELDDEICERTPIDTLTGRQRLEEYVWYT